MGLTFGMPEFPGVRRLPQRGPIADLDRQHVFASGIEGAEQLARPHRRKGKLRVAILLPDQVQRAAKPPLPAQYGIRAERALVEVVVVDVEGEAAVRDRV